MSPPSQLLVNPDARRQEQRIWLWQNKSRRNQEVLVKPLELCSQPLPTNQSWWTSSLVWTWRCFQFCMARFGCPGETSAQDWSPGEGRSVRAGREAQGRLGSAPRARLAASWCRSASGKPGGEGGRGTWAAEEWEATGEAFLFGNANRLVPGKEVVFIWIIEGELSVPGGRCGIASTCLSGEPFLGALGDVQRGSVVLHRHKALTAAVSFFHVVFYDIVTAFVPVFSQCWGMGLEDRKKQRYL